MEFNKELFSELLLKAKGTDEERSLNKFSQVTNVDSAYLSRFINKLKKKPPTPEILKKISAKAYNGVTYEDLMIACGHISESKTTTDTNITTCEVVSIPLLGRIPAGMPIFAHENILEYLPTPTDWVKDGEYFYLQVTGDSMINARIFDGDKVLIRQQQDVENGEIAAVRINGFDATLKRVKKSADNIILYPENPEFEPIFLKDGDDFEIIGKVMRVTFEPKRKN